MAASLAACALPLMTMAQHSVEATVSADVVSSYIWRGQDLANVSVQPTLGVAYKGLSLSAWGSFGLMNNSHADYSTKELDFTLKYTVAGFNVGLTDYFSITNGSDPKYFLFKEGGAHVLEANLGYDFGPVAVQWYTNISGTPDRYLNSEGKLKHAFASYMEVSAPFRLISCEWLAAVGIVPFDAKGFYADANGFAVTNVSLRATKQINITPTFKLPLFGQLVANPSTQKFYFVAGITLGI